MRGARWILFSLLAALALLTLAAIPRLDPTADERVYWIAGRNIVATGQWEHVLSRLQGPLPLAASQLGSAFVAAQTSDDAAIDAARYGMAPLVVLAGWLVYRLGRRLFGERGGLSALALFVLHPLLYGYGALMAVDMTHCVTTLIAWLATGWACERPSARRVLVAGAALALPLATKYLACLVVPGLGLVFAVQAYRRTDPRWPTSRRAGRAALLLLLLAATALLALHGCYGFLAGLAPAEPAAYRSDFFRTVIGWPVLGDLLRWLPAPMLLGADFQMDVGETVRQPFLDGEFRAGHPDYYLRTFAYKTPDALLLLTALGLPLALGRWAREPGAQRVRVHLALSAASLLPLWLYTSLGSTLQIGIRYVLPTVPILLVFLGGAAAQISWRGPWRRTALALGLASLVFDLARSFPDGISYVNHFAGGPRSAVLHFVDSNADWGQWANSGPRRLRDRYPEIQILERADGPRLGLVAVRLEHKNQPDPLDLRRRRHWTDPFPLVDHVHGSWWVYEATTEGFEAALAGDARVRAEFAVALCAAGRLREAERAIAPLSATEAEPLTQLIAQLEAVPLDDTERRNRDAMLAHWWRLVGRPDRAIELLVPYGASLEEPERHVLGQSYLMLDRGQEGAALFRPLDPARVSYFDAVLGSTLLFRGDGPAAGVEFLDGFLAAQGETLTPAERAALAPVRAEFAFWLDLDLHFLHLPR